jgi:hypothetical protein
MKGMLFRMILLALTGSVPFMLHGQEFTQTIRGKITDAVTKLGLPGANVIILNSDPLLGANAGTDGTFAITGVPVGRHSVQVSYVGYQQVIIPAVLVSSGRECLLNVELREMAVTTGEVEIKAVIDKDRPLNPMGLVSARSFSVDETRRYAGSLDDPLRAVSNFAGVASNAGVNSNQIMIRGNSPKGLLWRVEGVDIPNPNHFAFVGNSGGGFSIFSSQVLSNSDFYTAAFPAQYGNALSGVFDMRFRNGNNYRHEYALQLGVQGVDLAAEGPFTKKHTSSYLFNYRYSILSFLRYIDPSLKNKVPTFQDLSFKINIPTPKAGTFSVIGIGGISNIKTVPVSDTNQWKTLDDRSLSTLNNKMGALAVIHQFYLNRDSYVRSYLSATYSDIYYDDNYMTGANESAPQDSVRHVNYRVTASVSLNNKIGTRYTIRSGFAYNLFLYNIDLKSVNPFTGVYGLVAKGKGNTGMAQAWSESRIDLTNYLFISGGLYFQYLVLNGHYSLEPRIAMSWQVTRKHTLSVGFGMHSQIEDIGVYLAEVPGGSGLTFMPNRNLDFSRGYHVVLGYDFSIRPDMRFKAETYYQYLYHIPVIPGSYYSLINSFGGYTNDTLVNRGTGRNAGIDLTFEKFLTNQFYALVTTSLFTSQYTGGDGHQRNTQFNSNYVINVLAGKEWTIRKRNILGVNLKATLTGGEYYVPINLGQSVALGREVLDAAEAYNPRLQDVFYIDLTITYRTNHKKFSGIWALQIRNLLGQRPVTGYVYNPFNQAVEPEKAIGIIPLLSYKVEF